MEGTGGEGGEGQIEGEGGDFDSAAAVTAVARDEVAIVALLGAVGDAVSAAGKGAVGSAVIGKGIGVLLAVVALLAGIQMAVAAERGAVRCTGLADVVLALEGFAILGSGAGLSSLETAVGAAGIVGGVVLVPVVADLAEFLDVVAADGRRSADTVDAVAGAAVTVDIARDTEGVPAEVGTAVAVFGALESGSRGRSGGSAELRELDAEGAEGLGTGGEGRRKSTGGEGRRKSTGGKGAPRGKRR